MTTAQILSLHTVMLWHLRLAVMGSMIAGDLEAPESHRTWAREAANGHYAEVVRITLLLDDARVPRP